MGHASVSCLQAGSSVSSVHATAYEAIDHMAIIASPCWLLACFTMPLSACWRGLGIIQHHQARGTDAMSDGTRLVDDGLYCGSWRKWPCRLAQKRLAQDDPHAHKRHAQHGHARLCLMAKRSGMWRRAGSAVLFNRGIADNS